MHYISHILLGISVITITQINKCASPSPIVEKMPSIALEPSNVLDSIVQHSNSKSALAQLVEIKPEKKVIEGYKLATGAENTIAYQSDVYGKRVGLVVNQTSLIGKRHLVDSLIKSGVKVEIIFAPEHGFRGQAEAGEEVANGSEGAGIPVISLYGKKHRPSPDELAKVDVLIFDIQDVGARFYTYLTTLFYVMEECAKYDKKLVVLDRPNPNGHYIDGPILQPSEKSFVGALPLPIVHGCTFGELALMINGENWLNAGGKKCNLVVVPCANYSHFV